MPIAQNKSPLQFQPFIYIFYGLGECRKYARLVYIFITYGISLPNRRILCRIHHRIFLWVVDSHFWKFTNVRNKWVLIHHFWYYEIWIFQDFFSSFSFFAFVIKKKLILPGISSSKFKIHCLDFCPNSARPIRQIFSKPMNL